MEGKNVVLSFTPRGFQLFIEQVMEKGKTGWWQVGRHYNPDFTEEANINKPRDVAVRVVILNEEQAKAANLRWEDVDEGYVEYRRTRTGKVASS